MNFIIILLSLSVSTNNINLPRIASILKQVESSGNTKAIGDSGKAYGVLQIHRVCVEDINRYYKTNYTHQDAFNEICAEEIFSLYISMGIEIYESKFGRKPTEEQIVKMWNGGCYRGYEYKSTEVYYKKYLRFKKKFNI